MAASCCTALRHFFRFWLWFLLEHGDPGMGSRTPPAPRVCGSARRPSQPGSLRSQACCVTGLRALRRSGTRSKDSQQLWACTPDDWLERNLYSRFPKLVFRYGWFYTRCVRRPGHRQCPPWACSSSPNLYSAAGVINGLATSVGYRVSNCRLATNIVPWGLLIVGEELHNNHHAFPSSARLCRAALEIDVGWLFIRVFRGLGPARVGALRRCRT